MLYGSASLKAALDCVSTNHITIQKHLTDLSVEDLFLSVANRFNDLEEGLEESEIAQPPSLIIELLPLRFLQAGGKNKQKLCLIFHFLFLMKW